MTDEDNRHTREEWAMGLCRVVREVAAKHRVGSEQVWLAVADNYVAPEERFIAGVHRGDVKLAPVAHGIDAIGALNALYDLPRRPAVDELSVEECYAEIREFIADNGCFRVGRDTMSVTLSGHLIARVKVTGNGVDDLRDLVHLLRNHELGGGACPSRMGRVTSREASSDEERGE